VSPAAHPSTATESRFDEAAEWLYLTQGDASVRNSPEFQDWLKDPEHASAFEALLGCMEDLNRFRDAPAIQHMRRAAIARLESTPHPWRTRILAAAAMVVFSIVGVSTFNKDAQTRSFTTEVGSRRVVTLEDGSRISLDSDTGLTVHYSSTTRSVILEKGRGRFDVAHNAKRPFTVTVGNETVVAVGTAFEVEKLRNKTIVTLLQGRILIKDAEGNGTQQIDAKPPISLTAGEQMTKTQDGKQVVDHINLDAETAWESGHLVFRGVTLQDAAEQVNRYAGNPILVDPSISGLKISGVFNAGDVGAFIKAVTAYFPISATTNANNAIVLNRRS
jgi:transmembrane sensor